MPENLDEISIKVGVQDDGTLKQAVEDVARLHAGLAGSEDAIRKAVDKVKEFQNMGSVIPVDVFNQINEYKDKYQGFLSESASGLSNLQVNTMKVLGDMTTWAGTFKKGMEESLSTIKMNLGNVDTKSLDDVGAKVDEVVAKLASISLYEGAGAETGKYMAQQAATPTVGLEEIASVRTSLDELKGMIGAIIGQPQEKKERGEKRPVVNVNMGPVAEEIHKMLANVDDIRLATSESVHNLFKRHIAEINMNMPNIVAQGQVTILDLIKDLLGITEDSKDKDLLKNRLDSIDANVRRVADKCCAEEGPFAGDKSFYQKLGKQVADVAYKPTSLFGMGVLKGRAKGPWTKVADPLGFIMDQLWKLEKTDSDLKDKVMQKIIEENEAKKAKGTPVGSNAAAGVTFGKDPGSSQPQDTNPGKRTEQTIGGK